MKVEAAARVDLLCGACGERAATILVPPLPRWSAAPFEVRTILKPVLRIAVGWVPALGPILDAYTRDETAKVYAAIESAGLQPEVRTFVLCAGCADPVQALADLHAAQDHRAFVEQSL